jgi:hypothetical protein
MSQPMDILMLLHGNKGLPDTALEPDYYGRHGESVGNIFILQTLGLEGITWNIDNRAIIRARLW